MVNQPSKQATVTYSYLPPTSADLLGEFEQNHRSYQSFKAKGLDKNIVGKDSDGKDISTVNKILDGVQGDAGGLFRRVRQFLTQVDLAKGPIERKVTRLERRRDLDPSTRKMVEYLVTHVEWVAKDFLGNELVSVAMKEGMYNDPIVQSIADKGKITQKYSNWKAVYDIPFSKEAVDKALDNQLNPPELVKYLVRTSQSERDDSYSLEQFRDSTFAECIEIHKQGKGLNR